MMKLAEALRILSSADLDATPYPVSLIAASTAEPLSIFLAAHLQQRLRDRRAVVLAGRFGDLEGNLTRFFSQGKEPSALIVEWADLDPRLGMRQTGGWGRNVVPDILETVEGRLDRLLHELEANPAGQPLLLVPPTLPMPPVCPVASWQVNALDVKCGELLSRFVTQAAAIRRVRVLRSDCFTCPLSDRLDLKSSWQAGSPYRLKFASELAALIAAALIPAARPKGIITDLDDTLWSGILGELGIDGVHWDLDHHTPGHGIYQQLLQSLAKDGVLLAAATKNDRDLVDRCLRRSDMLLSPESLYPVEAHWQPKAESVARILRTWNVGEDSVVFIDDNPLEIETVRAAFPTMRFRLFPTGDPDALWTLLIELNDLFGKAEPEEEDRLRLASIRAGTTLNFAAPPDGSSQEKVLETSGGELTLTRITLAPEPRALELLNKTNQFNLNGIRYSEGEWLSFLEREGACAWLASYRDKFGPLGRIALLAGQRLGNSLLVHAWVMSCRAFSRRIEYAMLESIFDSEALDEISLEFRATDRNTPFREFLEQLTGFVPAGIVPLTRADLQARQPKHYLTVGAGR